MAESKKILDSWKHPIYYPDYGNSPSVHPRLNDIVINLLVEEGVPIDLIRKQAPGFGFLDFEAHANSTNPSSVIISICTLWRKDEEGGFTSRLVPIFEIPVDKAERDRFYHRTPVWQENILGSDESMRKEPLNSEAIVSLNEYVDSVIRNLPNMREKYAPELEVEREINRDPSVIHNSLVHSILHDIKHEYVLIFLRTAHRFPTKEEREEINALTQNRVSDIKSAVKSLGWV